ncbi:MAG TPA: hypothetical protein DDZ53_03135, partial [Firmicutes bacterium]|nr:hypothetical protein [Bacillota bacterium]
FGRYSYNLPSRFLEEIPEEVKESRGWNSSPSQSTVSPSIRPSMRSTEERVAPNGEKHFADGQRVRHKSFGEGTVVSSKGSGADIFVTVAFDQAGLKTLSMQYTSLEPI